MRLKTVFAIFTVALTAPIPAPAGDIGNSLLPDWVRPGLRLTYDLLTGGVNRSADQLRWDAETHQWVQADINRGYDTSGNYNGEYASHGLVQATVAGLDGQGVALSQPFYLLSPNQRMPVLMSGANIDMLVDTETGGDFWMHPRKQAQMLRQPPGGIIVQSTTWRGNNQSWTATTILSQGASGKTFAAYDQASGKLLYLSRVTREPPGEGRIRDPRSPTKGNPVSYATIIKYVDTRQMNIPWMNDPLPDWTQQVQVLSYQGRQQVQFPGAVDTRGQALSQSLQAQKRGRNWLLFQSNGQAQWQQSTGPGPKVVTGTGLLYPLIIPPAGLARLRPGQEIDRDALTGFSVHVAAADGQTVTLQVDGPDRSMMFVYERAQGVVIRSSSRERSSAGQNMFVVREMQLARKQ
jgi:hypothetical protein